VTWACWLVVLACLSSPSAAQLQWIQAPPEARKIKEPINPSNYANRKLIESTSTTNCNSNLSVRWNQLSFSGFKHLQKLEKYKNLSIHQTMQTEN
jgi:cell division septal protein FtsQ